MNRDLTITVDEEVYEGLHQVYRLMAADETREAEAHEWAEGTCRDVADEAR
jgi:hypothetical protein